MRLLLALVAGCGLILPQPSHAWEVDQLTRRAEPLEDLTRQADERMDALLDEAVARVRNRLRCGADPRRARRALVRVLHRLVAADQAVTGRGALRALGYGAYAAWLEADPELPRRSFAERGDLFEGIPFGIAPVLSAAGVCSTVRLGDQLVGVDKVDHFLEDGFRYLRRSRWGARPERAVRWGTMTENTVLGWNTSSAFSRADLYANWQGLAFYLELLDEGSGLVGVGADGCVARTGSFSWARWVDAYWDELQYPSTYRPAVRAWLSERLDADPDAWCAGWDAWGVEVVGAHTPDEGAPWVGERARPRIDPFELARRCGWPAGRPAP